jgi:hypothetical protein
VLDSPPWTSHGIGRLPFSAGRSPACEEVAHGGVRRPRQLDLRNVAAVELDVVRSGERVGDMAGERQRDEPITSPPHEERLGGGALQARPEAIGAVRRLEVVWRAAA